MAVVLRGRKAESVKAERRTNKLWVSRDICTTHTHAVGMVAIPVFFVCVLCAPTHEPTYLSPLTCVVCLCTLCVCVREILARPLWFNPLLLCVCVCVHVHMCISLYPIIKQRTVSVSQRVTCPQWQEPYCLVYESYACTPLVICLQMAITNHQSQLVCLLAHSLSTIVDQMAACGLLVIRNRSVFQIFFSP